MRTAGNRKDGKVLQSGHQIAICHLHQNPRNEKGLGTKTSEKAPGKGWQGVLELSRGVAEVGACQICLETSKKRACANFFFCMCFAFEVA